MFRARLPCGFLVTLDDQTMAGWRDAETVCLFDALRLSGCTVEDAIDAASCGLVQVEAIENDAEWVALS